jgi:hypothetical protein
MIDIIVYYLDISYPRKTNPSRHDPDIPDPAAAAGTDVTSPHPRLERMFGGLAMRASATVSGATLTAATNTNNKATTTRRVVTPRAAAVSRVGFDGAKAGDADLTLRVARAEVAKGLVHKYVVMVRQNARRVSATTTTISISVSNKIYICFFSSASRATRADGVRGNASAKLSWTNGHHRPRARGPEP